MKEKTTILIADDNQEFSQTLANYIHEQEDMEVIGIAKDGEEAVDMITNINPDVVLLEELRHHAPRLAHRLAERAVLRSLGSARGEYSPMVKS